MKISVVINCDTRPGWTDESSEQKGLFNGCLSEDFLIHGVVNKMDFIAGFDNEIIVFVDEHEPLIFGITELLRSLTDTLIIRKHTSEEKFNEYNYLSALAMARGDIIMHFDQDCAAFASGPEPIQDMIDMLDKYDYVSYPSHWSPKAHSDQAYDYVWCSTRFFMCRRETLDFTEIMKCEKDYDYTYQQYPALTRNHWLEHILGLIAKYKGKGVYYPPVNFDKMAIFVWDNYIKGVLQNLNMMEYESVRHWVLSNGGIHWPNNLRIR